MQTRSARFSWKRSLDRRFIWKHSIRQFRRARRWALNTVETALTYVEPTEVFHPCALPRTRFRLEPLEDRDVRTATVTGVLLPDDTYAGYNAEFDAFLTDRGDPGLIGISDSPPDTVIDIQIVNDEGTNVFTGSTGVSDSGDWALFLGDLPEGTYFVTLDDGNGPTSSANLIVDRAPEIYWSYIDGFGDTAQNLDFTFTIEGGDTTLDFDATWEALLDADINDWLYPGFTFVEGSEELNLDGEYFYFSFDISADPSLYGSSGMSFVDVPDGVFIDIYGQSNVDGDKTGFTSFDFFYNFTNPTIGLASSSDTGVQGDNGTNLRRPTIEGFALDTSQVTLFYFNPVRMFYDVIPVDAEGNWSYTFATDLSDGDYRFSVYDGVNMRASDFLDFTVNASPVTVDDWDIEGTSLGDYYDFSGIVDSTNGDYYILFADATFPIPNSVYEMISMGAYAYSEDEAFLTSFYSSSTPTIAYIAALNDFGTSSSVFAVPLNLSAAIPPDSGSGTDDSGSGSGSGDPSGILLLTPNRGTAPGDTNNVEETDDQTDVAVELAQSSDEGLDAEIAISDRELQDAARRGDGSRILNRPNTNTFITKSSAQEAFLSGYSADKTTEREFLGSNKVDVSILPTKPLDALSLFALDTHDFGRGGEVETAAKTSRLYSALEIRGGGADDNQVKLSQPKDYLADRPEVAASVAAGGASSVVGKRGQRYTRFSVFEVTLHSIFTEKF